MARYNRDNDYGFNLPSDYYDSGYHGKNKVDDQFYLRILQGAENKGKKETKIQHHGWESEIKIGQIFHYLYPKELKKSKDVSLADVEVNKLIREMGDLKHVWVVDRIDSPEETKKHHGGGRTFINGPIFVLKALDSKNYLPEYSVQFDEYGLRSYYAEKYGENFTIGRFIITSSGEVYRIKEFKKEKREDNELTYRNNIKNPHKIPIYKEFPYVEMEIYDSSEIPQPTGKVERFDEDKLSRLNFAFVNKDYDKFFKEVENIVALNSLQPLSDQLSLTDGGNTIEEQEAQTNAIVLTDNTDYLKTLNKANQENLNDSKAYQYSIVRTTKNKAEIMQREADKIIQREMSKLEAFKNKFEGIKAQLEKHVVALQKKIAKIYRFIDTIEIFLGVKEELIQISEGNTAPEDSPICLRQEVLYMDEEFGDPMNGIYDYVTGKKLVDAEEFGGDGMDTKALPLFEKWMIESGNYKKIMPEEKCILAMHPRSDNKFYVEDTLLNSLINERKGNFDTIIYIRNGDNVYRIESEKIHVGSYMFPTKALMEQIQQRFAKLKEEYEDKMHKDYYKEQFEEKYDEIEKDVFAFKKNAFLYQGLIFRTQIFQPLHPELNFFNVNTWHNEDGSERIKFIYDGEAKLPHGKMLYKDWLKEVNKDIKKGSRICFVKPSGRSDYSDRFSINFGEHRMPPMPDTGVYEVREYNEEESVQITKEFTLKEWEKEEAEQAKEKFKNPSYKPKYEHMRDIYEDIKQGVESDEDWWERRRNNKKIGVLASVKNANGWHTYRKEFTKSLRVSYNPQDEVYRDWGRDSGTRATNLTFKIDPKDKFIINFDNCLLEDIDFYLGSRVDRHEYRHMMPTLWAIKKRLLEEMKDEDNFTKFLSDEIENTYNLPLKRADIEKLVRETIKWYKDEIVKVWKRAISSNDTKAYKIIKNEVTRILKNKFKKQMSDVTFDSRKKVLIYKAKNGRHYISTGVFKKDFVHTIWNESLKYEDGKYKELRFEVDDNTTFTNDEELVKLANENTGKVLETFIGTIRRTYNLQKRTW